MKTSPRKIKLKRVTLKKVIGMALKDKAFLNAMLKNPARALEKKKKALSPRDLKTLKRMLAKNYRISGKKLITLLFLVCKPGDVPPWPIYIARR